MGDAPPGVDALYPTQEHSQTSHSLEGYLKPMSATHQQWLNQVGRVLETLNEGVIINDERRRAVFANSMFLEMIKMPAQDLLGHAIAEFFPPEDVPQLLDFIARRETQGGALYEFYIPQADGGRLPVAVTSRHVVSPDGRT